MTDVESQMGPKTLCCLCFDSVPVRSLYRDLAGYTWDMCRPCALEDALQLLRRLVEGAEEPISTGNFMRCLDASRLLLGLPHRSERGDG